MDRVNAGDYVAILAFLPSDQGWEEKLEPLRRQVQTRGGAVTCVGIGPRYLHSSGQLHKGGPGNSHFLVLTAAPAMEAPVPGQPYGFSALIDAQARGDIEVLKSRGRNVLHIGLGPVDSAEDTVRRITEHLARAA